MVFKLYFYNLLLVSLTLSGSNISHEKTQHFTYVKRVHISSLSRNMFLCIISIILDKQFR